MFECIQFEKLQHIESSLCQSMPAFRLTFFYRSLNGNLVRVALYGDDSFYRDSLELSGDIA